MKIGIKDKNIMYDGEDKVESDVIELISCDPNVGFNAKKIVKLKEYLKGKDLSMHSQAGRVFSSVNQYGIPVLADAELNVLRAEVVLCKTLGIKEMIFHLKAGRLTGSEIDAVRSVLDFSKEFGVEMIFESNYAFVAEETLAILDEFPGLNYNLDLGHLNIAIGEDTLGMSVEDFISRVGDRLVYVHAHNNDGIKDTHSSLANGTLDWRKIFGLLDFSHIRKVIAEVWGLKARLETKNLLEEYFNEAE
jgi:sugar phosphate isomerase/epimerase